LPVHEIREKSLPPEVARDDSLMQYAVKGSEEQWGRALSGRDIAEAGTVQIRSVREKRKGVDEEDFKREAEHQSKKAKSSKKKKKKKRA